MISPLLVTVVMAAHSPPVGTCPAETPTARQIAQRFMTSKSFVAERQELGIGDLTHHDLILLRDVVDDDVCRRINDALVLEEQTYPRVATYYRVGNRYLIVTTALVPADATDPGWQQLIVLDDRLRPIHGFAM